MLAKMKEMMERLATLHTTPISTSRSQAVRWAHCVDQNSRQPFRWNLDAEVRFKGDTEWSKICRVHRVLNLIAHWPSPLSALGKIFIWRNKSNKIWPLGIISYFQAGRMCDGDRKIWWFMVCYHGQPAASKFSSMEPKIFVQNPSTVPRPRVRRTPVFI